MTFLELENVRDKQRTMLPNKNNIKHSWGVTVEFRGSRVHHMPQHKIIVSQSLYQSGAT